MTPAASSFSLSPVKKTNGRGSRRLSLLSINSVRILLVLCQRLFEAKEAVARCCIILVRLGVKLLPFPEI